jgi:hypothetical protein
MLSISWPHVENEDPNMKDVHYLAGRVSRALNLQLPTELPGKEIGVEVVELVEKELIKGSLIRECTSQKLVERREQLVNSIHERKLLPFRPSESFVVALYIWHGCLCMVKNTRQTYVVGIGKEVPYSVEDRQKGYDQIQQCWLEEDNRGNPWIRYGVSLARLFRKGEKKVEDWIPKDSPYWE